MPIAPFGPPIGTGLSKRITATVGTSVYTISPATAPADGWRYLRVMNLHATALLSVGINEDTAAAPAANPGVAGNWQVGYDISPGGVEMLPLSGPLTTIRLLSDTASTPVALNLLA